MAYRIPISVTAIVSVSERAMVLGEADDGVVWFDTIVGRTPYRASEYDIEEAVRQVLYDARWAVAEAAREQGFVPFRYSLGTQDGFPYFFDGARCAIRFVKAPAENRSFLFGEITHRES